MSLQLAAQHLASHGRGKDKMLVHMSRNEVKSLNDIAMAHGGSLTINPTTGLPEAGFLESMLPMIAGAGLMAMGVPTPLMAAGIVGGASYLMHPEKGLMGGLTAGLGAYGGAGLAGGLGALGTSEAGASTQNAMTAAADEAEKKLLEQRAAEQAAKQTVSTDMSLGQAGTANAASVPTPEYLQDYGPRGAYTAGSAPLPTSPGGLNVTAPAAPVGQVPPANALDIQTVRDAAMEGAYKSPPTGFEAMKQGAASVFDDPSKIKAVGGGSYLGAAGMGLAAATPALTAQSKLKVPETTKQPRLAPYYKFKPGMATPTPAASATGVENTYFPGSGYTQISPDEAKATYGYAADGGLMNSYAAGGPVEQMSNQAALGANTMYPMSNIGTSAFATPYQTPTSTNMLAPAGGGTVDSMTGEPTMQGTRLATGGKASAYRTTLSDSLEAAYTKAQEKNDTATMRAIEEEMEIRETNKAGMEQGLSGMKGLATGGISGSGSLDLNIPLEFGGTSGGGGGAFGGANANGYQAAGSGFQDQASPTVDNQQAAVDPNSISAAAQGFAGGGVGRVEFDSGMGNGPIAQLLRSMNAQQKEDVPQYTYDPESQEYQQMATGGISNAGYNLGGYSDGGRLLRGPGDGVSDSIPATIGKKQPARLADGEFVVPARIVSELGNGSTEAGARRLYAMMDRIQAARGKTVGKGKVAKNSRADRYLPA